MCEGWSGEIRLAFCSKRVMSKVFEAQKPSKSLMKRQIVSKYLKGEVEVLAMIEPDYMFENTKGTRSYELCLDRKLANENTTNFLTGSLYISTSIGRLLPNFAESRFLSVFRPV